MNESVDKTDRVRHLTVRGERSPGTPALSAAPEAEYLGVFTSRHLLLAGKKSRCFPASLQNVVLNEADFFPLPGSGRAVAGLQIPFAGPYLNGYKDERTLKTIV